jgi:hypothetical protein
MKVRPKIVETPYKRLGIFAAIGLVVASACAEPPRAELLDAVETAAQDLRWNKQTSVTVAVKVRGPEPYVALALGPGTYTLEQRQALVPSTEARALLAKHPYTVTPDAAALYIFLARGSEGSSLRDHIIVPRPLALWKRGDTPLEISLEGSGDDVRIVGLR